MELESIRRELEAALYDRSSSVSKNSEVYRRERLKTIEAGSAQPRIRQSEDRLQGSNGCECPEFCWRASDNAANQNPP